MIDLTSLPDISFCETGAAEIQARVIADYETVTGRTLYPGDPERLFLEGLVYIIVLQRFHIDYTGKMNLLRYATGDYLDHIGAMLAVERLAASAATCTVRFSLDQALDFAVAIPAGTRVTPDSSILFATDQAGEIPAGDLYADLAVTCQDAGASGNGFLPGQISLMVDSVAYVATVANTTQSLGGSDAEADDSLRERIQLAPESFATAGPRLAYVFWVKSTHQDIIDVSVTSPEPGEVDVRFLVTGGELPSAELVAEVLATLDNDKLRPLTDNVSVAAPETVETDVEVTWWLARPDASLATQVRTAVDEAVTEWVAWQRSRIGRDINPSVLVARIMGAGAKRVDVTTPAYQTLTATQVWQPGELSVSYGGVEEE